MAARDIVVEAFSRTFAGPPEMTDDEFAVLLFSTARELCRSAQTARGTNGSLNGRERELLALVFDARLRWDHVRRLMGTSEGNVASLLLRALRKLKSDRSAPAKDLHYA